MAISQRGSATNGTAQTSTTVDATKPSGVVENDVLIAVFTSNNQAGIPPSGWTKFADDSQSTLRLQCYWKVAGASEPSTYQWAVDSEAPLLLTLSAWQGVDTADVFDIDVQTSSSDTQSEPHSTPSLSGLGATSGRVMYVRTAREASSAQPTFTESSATASELADVAVTSTSGDTSYGQALFSENNDYSTTSSKPGLAVTCSVSENQNVTATWALKALAVTGTVVIDMILPVVDAAGEVVVLGTLGMVLPLAQVQMEGQATPPEGDVSIVVPLTQVDLAGLTDVEGTLDTAIDIGMDVQAETRYFGDNVIVIPPDIRVVQVVDAEQVPRVIYDKHPGHLIRQPFAGQVAATVTAFNPAFDYAPSELAAVSVEVFQPGIIAGGHGDAPSASATVTANNATVRIQPKPDVIIVDVS